MRFWCDKCQERQDYLGGLPEWHRCQGCRLDQEAHRRDVGARWVGAAIILIVAAAGFLSPWVAGAP